MHLRQHSYFVRKQNQNVITAQNNKQYDYAII